MECLVLPVSMLKRRYLGWSRLGYRPLSEGFFGESEGPVTVMVGKEKREFLVDPCIFEESPFRVLMDMVVRKENIGRVDVRGRKRMIWLNIDALLFEHMLWLMHNDCSSLSQLNLEEIQRPSDHFLVPKLPMECLVLPVSMLKRRYLGWSRLGYRPLSEGFFGESEGPVTVMVGKEKREFLVDPCIFEESPFRVLMDMVVRKENIGRVDVRGRKRMIWLNIDALLFEHMLWLMHNDCSSLSQLNLEEIVDFYAQDN
ncbi:unnamed protein product [Ilex paraguariensis]|uniref:Uncharacterized protein n=1 Tax=Ilex paraguariensis TaxID=185542 RepID=A0ABC8TV65_9AQUA